MPKLEELTWDQMKEYLVEICDGKSGLVSDQRERLFAKALLEVAKKVVK